MGLSDLIQSRKQIVTHEPSSFSDCREKGSFNSERNAGGRSQVEKTSKSQSELRGVEFRAEDA
jgi:hypothetical protein